MKIAISIPDPLFEDAEYLARQMGKSRSRLYADAIAEYVEEYRSDAITEKLNEVYGDTDSNLDPAFMAAQLEILEDEDW